MKPSLQAGFQALPQLYDPEFQQVSVLLADYAVVFRFHRRAQFILRHGAGAERREGHAPPVVPFPLAEYHAQGFIFPRGEREAVIAPRRISLSAKRDAVRPPLGGGFGGLCDAVGIGRDKLTRPAQELNLPSAPKQFLHYFEENDRPQTRLDRNTENGMAVCIGRLREDTLFDYKFACMSHNTLRGAAGGAVLLAELLAAKGYFD